jgi:hypothetical protein
MPPPNWVHGLRGRSRLRAFSIENKSKFRLRAGGMALELVGLPRRASAMVLRSTIEADRWDQSGSPSGQSASRPTGVVLDRAIKQTTEAAGARNIRGDQEPT